MTAPSPRARERAREQARLLGLDRLNLFVPALMSVGLLVWVLSEVTSMFRARADETRSRRGRVAASAIVDEALSRTSDRVPGLRPRPVYLLIAAATLGAGAYVLVGSIGNYARPDSYLRDIAWLLGAAAVTAVLAAVYGGLALVVFVTWPTPPAWARGALLRTPLGSPTLDDERSTQPSWRVSAFVHWTIAALAALAAWVAWAPERAESFNQAVGDRLGPQDLLVSIAFLVPAGQVAVALGVAVVTIALAYRCRVLVVGYIGSVLIGSVVCLALRPLVAGVRPQGSVMGDVDSFPNLATMLMVIFAGLVPLTLAVFFERTWIIRPLRLAFSALAAAAAAHQIADGALATDVLGGVLLGLAAVGETEWLMAGHRVHKDCNGCPWSPSPYHGPFLGAIPIHPTAHQVLSLVARLTAAAATVGLAFLTFRIELPAETSGYGLGDSVRQTVQYALTLVMSAGALLAWKWEGLGALLIAVAAAGAGIFAALEYVPGVALVLTLVLMTPAVLLWLSWQHRRSPREIVALAVVTTLLIGSSWAGANEVHDHFFGPTHTESVAPDIPVDRVEWVWSGALSATGITVNAELVPDVDEARLTVEPVPGGPAVTTAATAPDEYGIVRFTVGDLRPDTAYEYRLVVDGRPDEGRGFGSFATPGEGAYSFTMTASACARTGSNVAVFDTIRAADPLFHLVLGDLHYENIDSTDQARFVDAYGRALSTPAQSALARQAPTAYVWDDHDYGPNDADASFVGRAASRAAYRAAVPHYPVTPGDAPINQAFTIGRVRFVLTDQRSEHTDDTMLGAAQKAWLLDELRTSSRSHALVVWVNSVPWIGPADPGSDNWAGQPAERTEIADVIATEGIENLLMLSGDAHMLAIDDGTNSDYSTTDGAGFPLFHTAALDRPGSVKGGPYSEGAIPGFGQFGVVEFVDDGGPSITVRLSGRNWHDEELLAYEHTFAVPSLG